MSRGVERSHATLQTVADAAGVSIQTVSNIFNAPHKVLPETRARVQAEIAKQGYRPNRSARSLRNSRAGLLGYCVQRSAPGGVGDRFIHAVAEAAERAGYHVLLFTEETAPVMGAYEALVAQRAVDGFILSDTTVDDARQQWLLDHGIPFAAFGRRWADPEVGPWVDVDGAAGMAAVADHLAAHGHRSVGVIAWPTGSGVGDDRVSGFQRAADKNGLGIVGVERGDNTHATGARLAGRLLQRENPPTAIVCVSDDLAIGADAAARTAGRVVGRDLAVTGFDDSPAAALPSVGLTSVRQPLADAGDHVVRLLTARLRTSDPTVEHVLLVPKLVVRASSDFDVVSTVTAPRTSRRNSPHQRSIHQTADAQRPASTSADRKATP